MKILVKIGGTLLDSPELRNGLASQLASVSRAGHDLAIVHGGGKQITRFLEARGIRSRFLNGMRVTTPEILNAAIEVLRTVNSELVAALRQAGAPAAGLVVDDGTLVEAEQMDPELGAVGRVTRCHPHWLNSPGVPVVACIAGDSQGQRYNVNGDQMAAACAVGFDARKLVFLTDVEGVFDAEGRTIPILNKAEAEALIANGIARGGMQAKLNAAISAIEQGVAEVQIVPGAADAALARILVNDSFGTRMVQ